MNVALSSVVEFADVPIEVILQHVDFAVDVTFKFGNSAVNFILSSIFGAGKLRSDGGLSFNGDFIDDPLSESDGVDADDLGVSLVVGGVKFNTLS